MAAASRVDLTRCYVLHTQLYAESSLIVDVLSRDYGRLSLLAKGARRPASPLRGLLMAFQPVKLSWHGRGELRTLRQAEWQGGVPRLSGAVLLCGFYLNELLIRLLAREDVADTIFDIYHRAVVALAHGELPASVLRSFERSLLPLLGYGMSLEYDAAGQAIQALSQYTYQPNVGLVRWSAQDNTSELPVVSGETLLSWACEESCCSVRAQQEIKLLMRYILTCLLGVEPLRTRRIVMEWQQF